MTQKLYILSSNCLLSPDTRIFVNLISSHVTVHQLFVQFFFVFYSDKERDVESVTYRLRKDLENEARKQSELQNEIKSLDDQLLDAKNGLLAASRITDQLESCQVANATLKTECEYLLIEFFKKKFIYYHFDEFVNNHTPSIVLVRVSCVLVCGFSGMMHFG